MDKIVDPEGIVFYGEVPRVGPLFIIGSWACRLARTHWAINTSHTWGEFASKAPIGVMEQLFGDDRKRFEDFCSEWMYQALGWTKKQATEWFTDAVASYSNLPEEERYPLPKERCTAQEFMTDGDWPAWPARLMLDWLPYEIAAPYGEKVPSVLNGSYLSFREGTAEQVATALRGRGLRCSRNDDGVALASGNADPDWDDLVMRKIVEAMEKETDDAWSESIVAAKRPTGW